MNAANGNLYLTNWADNTNNVGPEKIAFDSANSDLYVTNSGNDAVSVISGKTNTVIGRPIPVGRDDVGPEKQSE